MTTAHNCADPHSRPRKAPLRPCPGHLEIARGGTFVALAGDPRPPRRSSGAKRGRIREFTRESRRRFVHRLEAIDWDEALRPPDVVEWFATLTVHRDEGVDHAARALRKLKDRFRRAVPTGLAAWKLEPQRRGAPHYHLVVVVSLNELARVVGPPRPTTVEQCDEGPLELMRERFEAWLLRQWREVTGQRSITQVRVEEPRAAGGLRRYMSKYMAKGTPVPLDWEGHRFWGFWGQWPRTTIDCRLYGDGRWRLRRMVRAWTRAKRRAARAAKGLPGSGPMPWRDRYGALRVCIPTGLLREMLRVLPGRTMGVREGPPICLT